MQMDSEHRVLEDFNRNMQLVDLHAQPEAIIEELDQTIAQAKADNKQISQVGVRFMQFCAKYDLQRITEQAQLYVEPFNARLGSMINAKTLVKDRFWIIEKNGQKLGTLQKEDSNGWIFLSRQQRERKYSTHRTVYMKNLDRAYLPMTYRYQRTPVAETAEWEVHGFPVNQQPYNPVFDVQKQLPMYTKTPKSKSQFCAGYYIICFEKGWRKAYCPKVITLQRYPYQRTYQKQNRNATGTEQCHQRTNYKHSQLRILSAVCGLPKLVRTNNSS
jgi:hypothetical protein